MRGSVNRLNRIICALDVGLFVVAMLIGWVILWVLR